MSLDPELQRLGRRLRDVIEPIAGSVYFAPPVHAAYEALGFGPSRGVGRGAMLPDRTAYYWSRGASLGDVPGETVAAAFAIFCAERVIAAVSEAKRLASREQILTARHGAVEAFLEANVTASAVHLARATTILRRMAEVAPLHGRPLFAGLRSLGFPGTVFGDFFRAADLIRELRGDAHVAAWSTHPVTAAEMAGISAAWGGINPYKFILGRDYPKDQAEAAITSLTARGLLDGRELTSSGLELRRDIEAMTDRSMEPVYAAARGDLEELIGLLEPIREECVAAGGYFATAPLISADLET